MDVKLLVDQIRIAAAVPFSRRLGVTSQRNAISLLLYGKPYSSALPAEKAGKLGLPSIDDRRVEQLRPQYGGCVDIFVREARKALGGSTTTTKESHMTATSAIQSGNLPPIPSVSDSDIGLFEQRATSERARLEWVTLNARNVHQGRHLRFVQSNGDMHALEDHCDAESAVVTVVKDNTVFHLVSDDNTAVSDHAFLAHVFKNGRWQLDFAEHALATGPEHLNLKREELDED